MTIALVLSKYDQGINQYWVGIWFFLITWGFDSSIPFKESHCFHERSNKFKINGCLSGSCLLFAVWYSGPSYFINIGKLIMVYRKALWSYLFPLYEKTYLHGRCFHQHKVLLPHGKVRFFRLSSFSFIVEVTEDW